MKTKNAIQISWSKYVNDENNWSYKDKTYGNKVQGKLSSRQYLYYNIIRGLPLDRGFTLNDTFDSLIARTKNLVDRVNEGSGLNRNYALKYITEYIECFGETLTVDEFLEKADEALRLHSSS